MLSNKFQVKQEAGTKFSSEAGRRKVEEQESPAIEEGGRAGARGFSQISVWVIQDSC